MKKTLLIIFILLTDLSLSAQVKIFDRERDGLFGQAKSVIYINPELYGDNGVDKNACLFCSETYYDKAGNIIEIIKSGGSVKWTKNIIDGFETYKYSSLAQATEYSGLFSITSSVKKNPEKPIEETENLFPADERYDYKNVYEYDSSGRIKVKKQILNTGQLRSKSIYNYDKNGKIIEEISETIFYKTYTVNKYDDKGNLTETSEKSQLNGNSESSRSKIVYIDYKFDSQGNWIERKVVSTYETIGEPFKTEFLESRTIVYY